MQTAGLMYLATSAGSIMVSSTLKPIVNSTISLLSSLRTSTSIQDSLEKVIQEIDLVASIKTIEATIIAMDCSNEPLKTASENVIAAVQQINNILTQIADITACHQSGYISRWRTLDLGNEITEIRVTMNIVDKRFVLLCNINSMKK
tara:strand:+ start:214 stop:654 length:441 start_codon:yes stop_codon:yes gene_type:complete